MKNQVSKEAIAAWFQDLQDAIGLGLEKLDGRSTFKQDLWNRPEGGGGRTRTIKGGNLIEKGGLNFSMIHGPIPKKIAHKLKLAPSDFFVTGVSVVLHPHNPWLPIIHMNVRYFETSPKIWWFGGGIDLTPHIIIKEKARLFHTALKKVCDRHNEKFYPKFKQCADDYFYLNHRKETRGIGGIFFDRLNENERLSKYQLFKFVQDVGHAFVPIYTQMVENLRDRNYSEDDKKWQLIRRGRYVEFNLIYDKGTKFGLDTNGRTESILVSMPPTAHWNYYFLPKNKNHQETLHLLKKNIDWINA